MSCGRWRSRGGKRCRLPAWESKRCDTSATTNEQADPGCLMPGIGLWYYRVREGLPVDLDAAAADEGRVSVVVLASLVVVDHVLGKWGHLSFAMNPKSGEVGLFVPETADLTGDWPVITPITVSSGHPAPCPAPSSSAGPLSRASRSRSRSAWSAGCIPGRLSRLPRRRRWRRSGPCCSARGGR